MFFLTVLALLDAMDKETPNLAFVFEEGSSSLVTLLVSFSSYFVKFVFGYPAFRYRISYHFYVPETIIEELFNFFKFPAHYIHHRFLLVFQRQSS